MALIFFTIFKDYDVEHLWVCQPRLRGDWSSWARSVGKRRKGTEASCKADTAGFTGVAGTVDDFYLSFYFPNFPP